MGILSADGDPLWPIYKYSTPDKQLNRQAFFFLWIFFFNYEVPGPMEL